MFVIIPAFPTFAFQFLSMHKRRLRTWAHIALLVANIIYGINYNVAKAVMPDHIKPFALASLRSLLGVVLFWISSLFLPKEPVQTRR